jgi:cellulose synthase operon protein C
VRRLQGQDQDAVELLRKIATRDKSDALSLNNLAWLLALEGKADESLEILKQAIALRGELSYLLDTRAVAYLLKGQHALAVADMENAIADSPTVHRYFHLAQAHLGAGNPGAARAALDRAKELGLTESSVDPLERTAYRQLRAKLDRP